MRQLISQMQVAGCKESFADMSRSILSKISKTAQLKVKFSKSGRQNEVKIQRDFLSAFILLSTHYTT